MMYNTNNLGNLLHRKYINDFTYQMNKLSNIFSGLMPAKYANISTQSGHGIKTKTLFKDGTFNRWSIRKITQFPSNSVIKYEWDSVISHRCLLLGPVYHMTIGSPRKEECYYCHEDIPKSIIGLWKLQNYDILIDMIGDLT